MEDNVLLHPYAVMTFSMITFWILALRKVTIIAMEIFKAEYYLPSFSLSLYQNQWHSYDDDNASVLPMLSSP